MNTSGIRILTQSQIQQQQQRETFEIDLQQTHKFTGKFEETQQYFQTNDIHYMIEPESLNNCYNYQTWNFSFSGGETKKNDEIIYKHYLGKRISGKLYFPSTFPYSAPVFYFDSIPGGKNLPQIQVNQNGKIQQYTIGDVIQHTNIYGDNKLCIPLLSDWNENTEPSQIFTAIEQIFNNPNFSSNDAPANPFFNSLSIQDQSQIAKCQAQLLQDFEYEMD